jgi:transposase
VIVDALGNPLALSLTGGQVHDITQAEALNALVEPGPALFQCSAGKSWKASSVSRSLLTALVEPQALLADKGYDADRFVESLTARAIRTVIPPKSNRKIKRDCDFALYRERNLVERFFNTIKHFRAIATRYEKTAQNFLAGLHLVCALAWLT